jgi:hypothetical protein
MSEANVHVNTPADLIGLEAGNERTGDVTSSDSTTLGPKAVSELMAHAQAVPQVIEGLTKLNQHLGDMFREQFGLDAILRNYEAPSVYRAFFVQVKWLEPRRC